MYQRAPLLTDSEAEDEAGDERRRDVAAVAAKPSLPSPPVVEEKIPTEPLKTLLSGCTTAFGLDTLILKLIHRILLVCTLYSLLYTLLRFIPLLCRYSVS